MRRVTSLLVLAALTAWPQAPGRRAPGLAEVSFARGAPEPLAIVVNVSNPIDDLSSAALRTIFLGTRSHWSDGKRITLVMRDPGDPERKVLLREVCGMTEGQLKTHFIRGLYTGEILSSPKILSTPAGVRKFVFNVPGAIGYLRLSDVDASVKVVHIDSLLPAEKGYKLRVFDQERGPGE